MVRGGTQTGERAGAEEGVGVGVGVMPGERSKASLVEIGEEGARAEEGEGVLQQGKVQYQG